jgi:8-oxo-dGTP diphosphatase
MMDQDEQPGTPEVVVGAAIIRGGRVLAQRRSRPPELAGRWELPGGRVERDESDVAALRRECREELGVEIVVTGRVGAEQKLPGGSLLRVYSATLSQASPEPRALEHASLRWLTAAQLAEVDWLDADRALVPDLAVLLTH